MKKRNVIFIVVVIVVLMAGSFMLGRWQALETVPQAQERVEEEDIQKHSANWFAIGTTYMHPLLSDEDTEMFAEEIKKLLFSNPTIDEENDLLNKMMDKIIEVECENEEP